MSTAQRWRQVAMTFHRVAYYVGHHKIPPDFEAEDLQRFLERNPVTGAERGVFEFCLHIWDRKQQPFELSQVIRWDEDHLKAFAAWASGADTGEPCQYF
ncbi:MAG TPA: hypothetical protein PKD55_15640 [Bellilinea sp.]|nr:hypothetical protein [Bellilinea sp.]